MSLWVGGVTHLVQKAAGRGVGELRVLLAGVDKRGRCAICARGAVGWGLIEGGGKGLEAWGSAACGAGRRD